MTKHEQHRIAQGVTQHCAAWHGTYGGRCLNCGYDPEREPEADDGPYDPTRAGGLFERLEEGDA